MMFSEVDLQVIEQVSSQPSMGADGRKRGVREELQTGKYGVEH